jgi:hypothetical protein
MAEYWEITTAKVEVDSAPFFKVLVKYFPDATTFVADGAAKILEVTLSFLRRVWVGCANVLRTWLFSHCAPLLVADCDPWLESISHYYLQMYSLHPED